MPPQLLSDEVAGSYPIKSLNPAAARYWRRHDRGHKAQACFLHSTLPRPTVVRVSAVFRKSLGPLQTAAGLRLSKYPPHLPDRLLYSCGRVRCTRPTRPPFA